MGNIRFFYSINRDWVVVFVKGKRVFSGHSISGEELAKLLPEYTTFVYETTPEDLENLGEF